MSDNNYNDPSFNVMVSEALADLGKDKQNIFTLRDTNTIGDAVKMMEEKGISQIPVYGKDTVVGMVQEKNLLRPVFSGDFALTDNISLAYSNKFKVIDSGELLSSVTDALLNKEVVLVTENRKVINIMTDIDILQYISQKGSF